MDFQQLQVDGFDGYPVGVGVIVATVDFAEGTFAERDIFVDGILSVFEILAHG